MIHSFRTEKKIEKTMTKNVPNLMKSINPQVQAAQQISSIKKHENDTKSHHNQSAQSDRDKKKVLKAVWGKIKTLSSEEQKWKW